MSFLVFDLGYARARWSGLQVAAKLLQRGAITIREHLDGTVITVAHPTR
jgi:hypothetical protein